jgi:hypothetical protein
MKKIQLNQQPQKWNNLNIIQVSTNELYLSKNVEEYSAYARLAPGVKTTCPQERKQWALNPAWIVIEGLPLSMI